MLHCIRILFFDFFQTPFHQPNHPIGICFLVMFLFHKLYTSLELIPHVCPLSNSRFVESVPYVIVKLSADVVLYSAEIFINAYLCTICFVLCSLFVLSALPTAYVMSGMKKPSYTTLRRFVPMPHLLVIIWWDVSSLKIEAGKLFAFFVDLKRAFPSLSHEILWYKLIKLGMSHKIIRIIKSLYDKAHMAVKKGGRVSEWCQILLKVPQGKILALYCSLYLSTTLKLFLEREELLEPW